MKLILIKNVETIFNLWENQYLFEKTEKSRTEQKSDFSIEIS